MYSSHYVYAVLDTEKDWVWFGVSKDPETRFKDIFRDHARYRLVAVAALWDVQGANLVRKHLHERWVKRSKGDNWFRYDSAVRAEIKRQFWPIIEYNGRLLIKRRRNQPYVDFLMDNRPK